MTSFRSTSSTPTISSSTSLISDPNPSVVSVSIRFSSSASTASSSASSISFSITSRSSSINASSNSASASSSSKKSSIYCSCSYIWCSNVPSCPITNVTFLVNVTASCPVAHPPTISNLDPTFESVLIVNIAAESSVALPCVRYPLHPMPPFGGAVVNLAGGSCCPSPPLLPPLLVSPLTNSNTYCASCTLSFTSNGIINFTTYSEEPTSFIFSAKGTISKYIRGSRL